MHDRFCCNPVRNCGTTNPSYKRILRQLADAAVHGRFLWMLAFWSLLRLASAAAGTGRALPWTRAKRLPSG